MATETTFLRPGDTIPDTSLPKTKKGTLTLGPGLRHIPPTTISATTSGTLHIDPRKSALWIEHPHGRYQPAVGDLVVAQVHHSSAETWHCAVTPHTPYALLPQLAFEGANKKNRPKFESGDLVYARVSKCSKWDDTELECVNPSTGKADGMGPLKGGMVFDVSPGFARRLMMGGGKGDVVVLEAVGEKVKFEVAVGRNGRVWVDSGSVGSTVMVGRLLRGADEEGWGVDDQRREVKKALKNV